MNLFDSSEDKIPARKKNNHNQAEHTTFDTYKNDLLLN